MVDLDVLERRKKVFTLKMVGVKNKSISQKLNIKLETVESDHEWLKKNAKKYIENFDPTLDIGMSLKKYEEMLKIYWRKYVEAEPKIENEIVIDEGNPKQQYYCLAKIQELEENLMKIKMSCGLWPNVSELIKPDENTFESRIIAMRKERGLPAKPDDIIMKKLKAKNEIKVKKEDK